MLSKFKKIIPRQLRFQLTLFAALIISVTVFFFTVVTIYEQSRRARDYILLQTRLFARSIAASSLPLIVSEEFASLEEFITLFVKFPNVLSIIISDHEGAVLTHIVKEGYHGTKIVFDKKALPVPLQGKEKVFYGAGQMTLWYPILEKDNTAGWIELRYALDDIRALQRGILRNATGMGVILVIVNVILIFLSLRHPLRAIQQSIAFSKEFIREKGIQIPVNKSVKEIEELMTALNYASAQLKQQEIILLDKSERLREAKVDLERKVLERTADLKRSNERLLSDIEERKKIEQELISARDQLIQSEKLASVGQLAAGVAHEINNPIGFVNGNIQILFGYWDVLQKVLRLTKDLKQSTREKDLNKSGALVAEMEHVEKEANFDFIMNDMTSLLRESGEGLDRVKKIILDLRTLARHDQSSMESIKIEEVVDGIWSIVQNEVKYRADMIKEYGETPLIMGQPQKLGQVFINLLINAVQAIEKNKRGEIRIRTFVRENYVCVEISDTGAGIAKENLKKIFDPFFTTKPVGHGTGLGLSVSYDIVKSQGGDIQVESVVGQGTTFTVLLPVPSQVS